MLRGNAATIAALDGEKEETSEVFDAGEDVLESFNGHLGAEEALGSLVSRPDTVSMSNEDEGAEKIFLRFLSSRQERTTLSLGADSIPKAFQFGGEASKGAAFSFSSGAGKILKPFQFGGEIPNRKSASSFTCDFKGKL